MECSVIIPVGPGHEQLAQQALQSVMLAANHSLGPFDAVHVIAGDDSKGEIGRSVARNRMVTGTDGEPEPWMQILTTSDGPERPDVFGSEWLFFLDADDLMCTPEFYGESAFAVVEPYVKDYDAVWGQILELHPDGNVMRRHQVARIGTYKAYIKTQPMLSCQMGHFARREGFPGFNEELHVCEDIDLYLREWRNLRCIKQEKPLFLNRRGAHTWMNQTAGGKPRYTGRDWSMRAQEMLKQARNEL